MARPKKQAAEKRTHRLHLRCTADEYKAISVGADRAQLSLSDYMRHMAIHGSIVLPAAVANDNLLSLEPEDRRALRSMANNLNQLTKRFHASELKPRGLDRCIEMVGDILEQIYSKKL